MRRRKRGLASLCRGGSHRLRDRARPGSRSGRAARASRGAGRLAQRRLAGRCRRGCAMAVEGSGMSQQDLLVTAQEGDERAFGRLVEPYRRELLAHCYRMLGAGPDAEDALQDALLDAWKGLPRFEGRSSLRSWLYTVTTNACFKVSRRRSKRMLPIDYGPPADPHLRTGEPITESVWIEPYPDDQLRYEERETVELAFVAALQHLPARQRAALLLRDVLGFSAREVGEILDTTSASIDSALQRAHKTVESR